jgi:two-component system LytT family sensor kinase
MRSRVINNIIFSNEFSYRWKRHAFFWLVVLLYHMARIGLMFPVEKLVANILPILQHAFFRGLVLNIPFTYLIVYFLFPRFFQKKKYFQFAITLILAIGFLQIISWLWIILIANPPAGNAIGHTNYLGVLRSDFIRILGNPPLICCLLLSLKTLKNWHLAKSKSEMLAKENANAELQLLKAQVHPHFLFNTLNNIYSFSLNQSPQTVTLIKKMSGMLEYMIHECDAELVPLEKELKLIHDYMGLEKVRYGKRLDMQIEMHGDFEDKFIAPLLMIPFVENSFKHGTSQMLRYPWIKLEMTTLRNEVFFRLTNGKPSITSAHGQHYGIGLLNVKKRLQLLYPDKHQLTIESTEDTFIVQMQIMLSEKDPTRNKIVDIVSEELVYA